MAIAVLLVIGSVIVVCPLVAASVPAKAKAKAKARTAALLFTVQGTGGTYAPAADGFAALTVTGVDQLATWFTDRPDRQAGTVPLPEALTLIGFDTDPPNAVVTVRLADAHHDALAVKLEAPVYDQDAGTLAFKAMPLRNPGSNLGGFKSRLDESLAPSFGDVALFLDDTSTPVAADGTPTLPGSGPAQSPTPPPNGGDYARSLHFYFRNLPKPPPDTSGWWRIRIVETSAPGDECVAFTSRDDTVPPGDSHIEIQYRVVTIEDACGFLGLVLTLKVTITDDTPSQNVLTTGQVRVNKPLGRDGDVRCITAFAGATCSGWSWDQVTIRMTST
jgi:hypothetical protein